MLFIGDGDFQEIGFEFFEYFLTHGGLKPGDTVFDVGCGVGRMMFPLSRFLAPTGRYHGIDVNEAGIGWCREAIRRERENFRFSHIDIFHPIYNPTGRELATDIKFPMEDESVDFLIAISLFTHIFGIDVQAYLGEMDRIIKPGGRIFVTGFLLSEADLLSPAGSTIEPLVEKGCEFVRNLQSPLGEIMFKTEAFLGWVASAGLIPLVEPIYGHWRGNANSNYQDIVILTKQ